MKSSIELASVLLVSVKLVCPRLFFIGWTGYRLTQLILSRICQIIFFCEDSLAKCFFLLSPELRIPFNQLDREGSSNWKTKWKRATATS
jgi:hypothetical protein